ncbi:MAG TPA: hypothetical protein PKN13_00925 [Accumulibacter sp.]|nr:hypothetical protein [Accumulibacter sp.]HMW16383.1 hypothetical protein [Accumulibacter sp.]HMX21476.1 hypothetical protein [Accumulibacter sp.]HMY06070.1 hypothetical protein [Accumulibacter sp.]HNC18943.1 hypothetical protein [Accumulibacter sp.]
MSYIKRPSPGKLPIPIRNHFSHQETTMLNQSVILPFAFFPMRVFAGTGQIPDLESLALVAIAAFTALVIYHRAK